MEKGTITTLANRITTDELFELTKSLYKAGYTRITITKSKIAKTYAVGISYQRDEDSGKGLD